MRKEKFSFLMTGFKIAFLIIIFGYNVSYSQSFVSPLSSDGGADTHTFKSDTVLVDAVILEDGSGDFKVRSFTTGISGLYSSSLSMFYIPLKYDLTNNFRIFFSLPYLYKKLNADGSDYAKRGYGDTMIGLTRSSEKIKFFTSRTTARMTIPTGSVDAQDSGYFIPMGYGGYTASLQESLVFDEIKTKYIPIKLFMSGIFVYYYASTQQIDSTLKYTFDNSFAWSLMIGSEFYIIRSCDLQLKINYIDIKERKYNSGSGVWYDANDSVKQINLLPFVKYRFFNDMLVRFGIIYPVKTIQDKDLTKSYDSKWKMVMWFEKRFKDT